MLVAHFIVLHVLLLAASAAFTRQACWQRNCLTRNDAGALCFVASANGQTGRPCHDDVLVGILRAHLGSNVGLSIAYYDDQAILLGASTWPIPLPATSPLFVCMSGRRTDADGAYRTLCRLAVHDDDVFSITAHARECSMDVAQQVVTDGCYNSARTVNGTDNSSAGKSPLDKPSVQHSFFVLSDVASVAGIVGGIVGICAAVMRYRTLCAKFLARAGNKLGRWAAQLILAIAGILGLASHVAAPVSDSAAVELLAIPATDHVPTADMTDGDSAAPDEGDAFRTAETVVEESDITNE
ncbi:hypothetical protein EXIGLDRAFT_717211 [Exidia glandulosa HHB12029]|uniref:Uncharacterized protein n=1 Tax=Exidia glandulosa HHB12029 TaxID=1314781 RepID=A0A165P4C7_EXIGL|nr:hypothetical protein EXIGLDRAFT_717211 [Exidia glandulosa HHB12029]